MILAHADFKRFMAEQLSGLNNSWPGLTTDDWSDLTTGGWGRISATASASNFNLQY